MRSQSICKFSKSPTACDEMEQKDSVTSHEVEGKICRAQVHSLKSNYKTSQSVAFFLECLDDIQSHLTLDVIVFYAYAIET